MHDAHGKASIRIFSVFLRRPGMTETAGFKPARPVQDGSHAKTRRQTGRERYPAGSGRRTVDISPPRAQSSQSGISGDEVQDLLWSVPTRSNDRAVASEARHRSSPRGQAQRGPARSKFDRSRNLHGRPFQWRTRRAVSRKDPKTQRSRCNALGPLGLGVRSACLQSISANGCPGRVAGFQPSLCRRPLARSQPRHGNLIDSRLICRPR